MSSLIYNYCNLKLPMRLHYKVQIKIYSNRRFRHHSVWAKTCFCRSYFLTFFLFSYCSAISILYIGCPTIRIFALFSIITVLCFYYTLQNQSFFRTEIWAFSAFYTLAVINYRSVKSVLRQSAYRTNAYSGTFVILRTVFNNYF